jgi:molybdopterin converting factor small subunit
MITILFFGNLGDIFPTMEISLPPSVITIEDLTLWLSENMFISEKTLLKKGNRISINKNIIIGNVSLKDGDEIAFMSPLSGG